MPLQYRYLHVHILRQNRIYSIPVQNCGRKTERIEWKAIYIIIYKQTARR
jgi:hypothetical protein